MRRNEPAPPFTTPERASARERFKRRVLFLAGLLFLALGAVGLVLPGLPGTPLLILAAASFARSSPRFEAWLLNHPRFGPPVRAWRRRGAIPRFAKWIACLSMAASYAMLLLTGASVLVAALAGGMMLAVAAYIISRPDR